MAKILGKEEALFVMTGTMGNLLCILRFIARLSRTLSMNPDWVMESVSIAYNSIFILACAEEEKKSSVVT